MQDVFMTTDRPYQTDAIEAAADCLQEARSTSIVMATGLGKTRVCVRIAHRFMPQGRILWIADRTELLEQARNEFERQTGTRPDLEQGDNVSGEGWYKNQVVCAMIQTLRSGSNGSRRWKRFDPSEFSLVCIDEADLAAADSYRSALEHFQQNPALKILGCSATWLRHDGKPLDDLFETRAFTFPIQTAIAEAWLVPVVQKYIRVPIELNDVRVELGDFNGTELREKLASGDTLKQIVSDAILYAGNRKGLIFADSVENAEKITLLLNTHRHGSARILTGETDKEFERPQMMADYRDNAFQWLVNVDVAQRGFDVAGIQCIVLAAPTCSITKQTQQLGRGTRTWPGCIDNLALVADRKAAIAASPKPDLLVLDLIKNYSRRKLPTVTSIIGGDYSDEVVEYADKCIRGSEKVPNVADVLEYLQRKHNAQILAEAREREQLRLRKKSASKDVDPFGTFGMVPCSPRGWESGRDITNEQRAKLEKWRIDGIDKLDYSQAEQLIAEYRSRTRRGLATYRQVQQLIKRWGMTPDEARRTSFEQASECMTLLARNNWKQPKNSNVHSGINRI